MTAERSSRLASALTLTRPVSRTRLYWTARAVMVSDHAQVGAFDREFFTVFGSRVDGADEAHDKRPDAAGAEVSPGEDRPASSGGIGGSATGEEPGGDGGTEPDAPGAGRSTGAQARDGETSEFPAPGSARGRAAPGGAEAGEDGEAGAPTLASVSERLRPQALRRTRARRARAALPADDAHQARDADAPDPPGRPRPSRRARRPPAHAARRTAHRRRPDHARAPPPARGAAPARAAVRHQRLDGALRPRVPAVPHVRGQGRRGVRLRDTADADHARTRHPQPGAGDPARRRRRAGLVERHPHRRRAAGVQRPPRPPRDGPRRGDRDPLRRLGARRPAARGPRDGAAGAARAPDRVGQPARRGRGLRPARGRHGRGAAATSTRSSPATRWRRWTRSPRRSRGSTAPSPRRRPRKRTSPGRARRRSPAARWRCRAATDRAEEGRHRDGACEDVHLPGLRACPPCRRIPPAGRSPPFCDLEEHNALSAHLERQRLEQAKGAENG